MKKKWWRRMKKPKADEVLAGLDRLIETNERQIDFLGQKGQAYIGALELLAASNQALKDRLSRLTIAIERGDVDLSNPIWEDVNTTAGGTVSYMAMEERQPVIDDVIRVTMSGIATTLTLSSSLSVLSTSGETWEPAEITPVEFSFGGLREVAERQMYPPVSAADIEAKVAEMLSRIDPLLGEIFEGAWEAFRSQRKDKNRQASHSMRELVQQLFRQLASDEEMQAAKIEREETKRVSYHFDQRRDFLIEKHRLNDKQRTFLNDLYDVVNKTRGELAGKAHKTRPLEEGETEADLLLMTHALWQLLVALGSPKD